MTSMMQRRPIARAACPTIAHSGYFLLVDQHLHIRGVYDSDRHPPARRADAATRATSHARVQVSVRDSGPLQTVLDIAQLVVGIAILYWGAEWLIRGSASVARAFGVKPLVDRADRRRLRHVGARARGRDQDRARRTASRSRSAP